MSQRPALLPVKHPLSYLSYSEPLADRNSLQNGVTKHDAKSKSSLTLPRTLEERVTYLCEHQQITNLLNDYGYVLDVCMVDGNVIEKWVDLFTEDCDVTYPFGNHKGKSGLAKWAMNAETRFHRMLHGSSNFTITFDPSNDDIAHARTTLHAVCGTDAYDLSKTFQEGGYYYWSFRKDKVTGAKWKISYLFLDVNWTSGDSLGLNESGAAEKEHLPSRL